MKRSPPDTRPSWRDEKLLVIREYRMADGSIKTMIDPDYERRYREMLMETSAQVNWRNDPTYDMKKGRTK